MTWSFLRFFWVGLEVYETEDVEGGGRCEREWGFWRVFVPVANTEDCSRDGELEGVGDRGVRPDWRNG